MSEVKFRCYLAGSFSSYTKEDVELTEYPDWRDAVIEGCEGSAIAFHDPRRDTPQGSIATFVAGDCRGVDECEVLFCFDPDLGGAAEMSRADVRGKLVVLCVDEKNVMMPHPFLVGLARRVVISLEGGILYLKNLAQCGLENEFHVAYEMISG